MTPRPRRVLVTTLLLASVAAAAAAQEPKSAALAKQLTQLLDAQKLEAIAAKMPGDEESYVAALYFSGSQLLVVAAKYSVPVLLNEKLTKKDYRDVYIDLNSASQPDSKCFIVDLGADGLKAKRDEGQGWDSYEQGNTKISFDGDWKKAKMTEEAYTKVFNDADARYAKMLSALIAQLQKPS